MASNSSSFSPFAIAAGKVPPGILDHDRDSSYLAAPMTAVLAVIASAAIVFYSIRMHVKINITKKLGWDDLICTLALLGNLVDLVGFSIATNSGPLGEHMWNITLRDFLGDNFVITSYILQVTGSLTLGLIKLAIFLCYYDIFWPLDWCRWTIITCASLSSAFYFSITVVQFYFMTARKGETLAKHFSGKLAARVTHLSIPTTSIGLAIDIILFLIPLKAIFEIQMGKKQKIRSALVFFVGILAILGSILSLVFKVKTYGNTDLTYHLALVNFFICSEMSLGICIACMPFFFRAIKHHRARINSISSGFSSLRSRFIPKNSAESSITSVEHDSNSRKAKDSVSKVQV